MPTHDTRIASQLGPPTVIYFLAFIALATTGVAMVRWLNPLMKLLALTALVLAVLL